MTGSPETSASMKVRWLALALAVGTFVLYSPAIWYDFVDYDDWMYVFKNQAVLAGLNLQGLHYAFTSFDGGSWMPLTWLSLMLDTTLFGARPEALHFTSLLLHSLTSGLLLVAMYRFTGNVWLSVVAIGIFALHPLRTESVVWIAERKDVLSGCCFALGLLAYKNYVNGPTPRRYGWVVGCLVLGLMSKPMLVTLPFVFLLLDFWPLRRMGDNWSAMRVKIWPLVCEKLPLFILIIASCVFTYWSQKQTGAMSRWSTDLLGRAGDVAGNYGFYLFKLVLPINRTVIYPQIHLAFPVLLLLGTGLIAMTVGGALEGLPLALVNRRLVLVFGDARARHRNCASRNDPRGRSIHLSAFNRDWNRLSLVGVGPGSRADPGKAGCLWVRDGSFG